MGRASSNTSLLNAVSLMICRSCTLLACTSKGNASIRSLAVNKKAAGDARTGVSNAWRVCGGGNVFFSKVHGMENYALYGG